MTVALLQGSLREPSDVVIAGGGVAALEALLALSEIAQNHVRVTLVAPDPRLTYRPLAVAEPFGISEPRVIDLERTAHDRGARFVAGSLHFVKPEAGRAGLADGTSLHYDALLVAIGTYQAPMLPGALTFAMPGSVDEFRALLGEIESGESPGSRSRFPTRCAAAPALRAGRITAAFAVKIGANVELHMVTPELRPLEIFGPGVSSHVARLLEDAGIRLHTGRVPLASTCTACSYSDQLDPGAARSRFRACAVA